MTSKLPNETTKRSVGLIDENRAQSAIRANPIFVRISPPTGINGGPVTVGTTPVELTFTGTTRIISIKSDSLNSGRIWFGTSNIDNAGANAFGELTADSAVEIELDDGSAAIYVASDTTAQKVYKAALT